MKLSRRLRLTVSRLALVFVVPVVVFIACEAPDPTGPAASSRITLTTTRSTLPADGSSTAIITAYVLNRNGLAADGPIYWSTTCGTLSEATGTISGGYASVTLTAPNYVCDAVVTADAVHAVNSIAINVYGFGIDLGANPQNIPADGASRSSITAYVYNYAGQPADDGTTVSFTTTAGTLGAASATTSGGWAVTSLTSSTSATTAMVRAQVEASVATTYVTFSTSVGTIKLTAFPSSGIPADGSSESFIRAVVSKPDNSPASNVPVTFRTTKGTLSQSSVTTDSSGVASSTLIAPYSTSDLSATVIAFAADKEATVSVGFKAYFGPPNPSPTPPPTFTRTPTPTPTNAPTNTPETTPTATPTPSAIPNTSTPTHTPTP